MDPMPTTISRRSFLKTSIAFASSVTLNACTRLPQNVSGDLQSATPVLPTPAAPDLELSLTAGGGRVPILPGPETPIWRYEAKIIDGDSASVQTLPDSYLGPILRVRRGQRLRIHFQNDLPDPSIIHWHGLHIPEDMDGQPRYAVAPGGAFDYDFTIQNRAGTYWFHPHPHQLTGPQVYFGLAGMLIVSDEEEAAAGLPTADFDLPLILQDRAFDGQNNLVYMPNGMMDSMTGVLGDRILVNGQVNYTLPVQAATYRLRLLNGSNSRIYRLAWADNTPLTIVATDGGLLEKPVSREALTIGPGERYELWVDFGEREAGDELRLVSLPFPSVGEGSMGMGMMGGSALLPNGASFSVMTFHIEAQKGPRLPLPEHLSEIRRISQQEAVNARHPRRFELSMQHMSGLINGRTFEMDTVTENEIVRLGDTEIWEFVNLGSGMGMMMGGNGLPHPMHIHGLQFQIIQRQADSRYKELYNALNPGFVDDGWKDTLLVLPGEQVRLLLRFEDYTGQYLYHCHNLEHEDGGMMRNYRIEI